MFRWSPVAMVRIALFFIAGIVIGIHCPQAFNRNSALIFLPPLLFLYGLAFLYFRHRKLLKIISGAIGLTVVALLGYLNVEFKTASLHSDHFGRLTQPVEFVFAEVKNLPEVKPRSFRIELAMIAALTGTEWKNCSGRFILYLRDTAGFPVFRYGDKLLLRGSPSPVAGPMNPGEFDLRQFLLYKNITHQITLTEDNVRRVFSPSIHGLSYYAQEVRLWAAGRIRRFVAGDQEQAIARALVLGVTEGLDNELQGAYAASGAMHILSVSGLHVGVIYAVILFLLKPLSGKAWSKWWVAGLSLVCLWSYAFVTGLSPSVLRAVTMFSFLVVAKPFARDTNIFNTLAASAFLLLINDPFLIMSVGFQLSYMAVIGILWFYPPLYAQWEPGSWLPDKGWQLISVSLAAQLATLVPGLYYFHQFPVYFLLANLMVVPLSSFVLLGGVILLATSFVDVVANGVGWVVQWSIAAINYIVTVIEQLPASLIQTSPISASQAFILCCLLIAIVRLLETKKAIFVKGGALFALAFGFLQWNGTRAPGSTMTIYRLPGHSALEWICAGEAWLMADSALTESSEAIRFHIQPNRTLHGVVRSHDGPFPGRTDTPRPGFTFFAIDGKSFLLVEEKNGLPWRAAVDYVIIARNAVGSLEELQKKIDFKFLILDSSNSRYAADRLTKEAGLKRISVHSVLNQGAFVLNFEP